MLGIFIDIETTGLDPSRHRILEIAIKAYDLVGGEQRGAYGMIVKQPPSVWEGSDSASLRVNGFTQEMCLQGKSEETVREEIIETFKILDTKRGNAVFIGQNSSFDRGFFSQLVSVYEQEKLQWPYHWLDLASMHWALETIGADSAQPAAIQLSKNQIAQSFKLPPEDRPHRAMNGVNHLILCYNAVLKANLAVTSDSQPTH